MIEDGKATITIKELDELRKSHDTWKEYWKTHYAKEYEEGLQEVEKQRELLKKKEKGLYDKECELKIAEHKRLVKTITKIYWMNGVSTPTTDVEWSAHTNVYQELKFEIVRSLSAVYSTMTNKEKRRFLKHGILKDIIK